MQVRFANSQEAALIYQFIQDKAEFDRSAGAYSGAIGTTVAKIQATIFGDCPFARVLFVENGQGVIGFALYGFKYSSFRGQPSIWLDDLYVNSQMRSKGAGNLLMKKLQHIAQQNNCSHLAWTAHAKNTAGLRFYNRLGAKIIKQEGDRCFLMWDVLKIV